MVYDVLIEDPLHKDAILNKAININAPVVDLPSLIAQSTYVISTVTTQVAETVANKCLPYLRDSQYYIDCNSTSPGILNAVNPGDATIEMLIGGGKGKEVVNFLQASNIKAKFYTD